MIRVGIVVQRYGNRVVGGAESLAADVAERLNARGYDVTVFTTAATDYITWENDYPPGESILKGVIVRRFSVDRARDIHDFNDISAGFFSASPEAREITEDEWIDLQGPVSTELLDAVSREQDQFDIFLFFTYLYYTTVKVMREVKRPLILFPTAHEEPPINMEIMKEVFRRPDAICFLTESEMEMVKAKMNPPGRLLLTRTGVTMNDRVDPGRFRRNYRVISPFILYAGRIEPGKGLEPVFQAFHEIRKKNMVDLVLMGRKLMEIPEDDGIRYVGFVSEEDKASAFRGAVCSVQPSPLESLSITTLESFAQFTPVIVNSRCDVLMEHLQASGGGLAFSTPDELVSSFREIFNSRRKRSEMGKAGYDYVRQYFSWDIVMEKITGQIREVLSGTSGT